MRIALLLWILCLSLSAENWPGWRGPRGDGTSLEKNLPTRWSDTDNIAWKIAIPGTDCDRGDALEGCGPARPHFAESAGGIPERQI